MGGPLRGQPRDPLCGIFGCDFMTGELVCNDLDRTLAAVVMN